MTNPFVTSLADDGDGSLRAALRLAEASPGPVTIGFTPSLAGGVVRLASPLSFDAGTAQADGDIDGDGTPDIAIDGGRLFGFGGFQPPSGTRHLDVGAGATLTLAGLVLRNAYGSAPAGSADPAVGSISNAGSLTLKGVVFEGVRAHTDHVAAGSPRPADAATIHNREGADLTLDGVLLFSVASRSGGRVAVEGAPPAEPGSSAVAGVLNEGALTLGRFGIRDAEASGPGVSFVASDAPGRTVTGILNRGTIEALTEPDGPPPAVALADRARFIGIPSAFLGVVDVDGGTGAALFAEAWLSGAQDFVSDGLSIGFARDDLIECGFGNDTVFAGGGDDLVNGGMGRDVLYGETGDDTLVGFSQFDRLFGGEGDDDLHLGDLVIGDVIYGTFADEGPADGGPGDDTFFLGRGGAVTLTGGSGVDTIVWANGVRANVLDLDLRAGMATDLSGLLSMRFSGVEGAQAGFANDILKGGGGDDLLLGGEGRDTLAGGAGSDTLAGGEGFDTLVGGAGRDVFVFGLANARDRIEDFTPGVDRMAFEDAASLSDLRIVDLKLGAEIRHAGGVVFVAGVAADEFRPSDFGFLLEG